MAASGLGGARIDARARGRGADGVVAQEGPNNGIYSTVASSGLGGARIVARGRRRGTDGLVAQCSIST